MLPDNPVGMPWPYVLSIQSIVVIMGVQCIILSLLSMVESTANEIGNLGLPLDQRVARGCGNSVLHLLQFAAMVVPGVVVASFTVAWFESLDLWSQLDYNFRRHWNPAFNFCLFMFVYGLINLPLSLGICHSVMLFRLKESRGEFHRAIRHLAERQEAAPRSKIFGE